MGVSWMLPVPVLLPLLSAGLALLVGRRPNLQQLIALLALSVTTLVSVVLAVAASAGPVVLDVGSWAAPIGITLVADRLSATMLLVSQVVTLAVLIYSLAQNLADDGPRAPIAIYFPTFLILSAGVSNAFLTGDLFNLFVGFEILLAASFILITLGGTRGRVRAGTVYVVVSIISSAIFLAGIALTYSAAGTVNMAQLAVRLQEIDPGTAQMIQVLLLVAFGIKAAVFPLEAWLPDSYPTAPAPVTAVFAGLLTKVGVYALIRLQFLLFPGDHLSGALTFVGLATMIVGILGAVAQDDIKRLLSFTLVSHIGFMVWGIALVSRTGLAAAIYYAAHHILVQTSLFLVSGLIERRTGTTSLSRLSGLARTAPVIAILYFISGINLVGIPPLTGFVGKLGLARASVEAATPAAWELLAGGIVTSFLTLYVFVKWWNMAFWQTSTDAPPMLATPEPRPGATERSNRRVASQIERAEQTLGRAAIRSEQQAEASRTDAEQGKGNTSVLMTASVAALVGVQLAMALFSGPVWAYIDRAAADQIARTPYIEAVLSQGDRGSGTSDEETEGSEVSPSPNPTASPLETGTPSPTPSVDPSPQSGAVPSPGVRPGGAQSGQSGQDPQSGTDGGDR
ncbi:Na+/H+ antiporter subunit D [Actinomyces sp.]|uniref:Na+/H+ antiporter subunit D n=1 Tax=Actinomyces sp. TaxID=29317 RepID=UPI00289A70D5|nr:Na+/H+ antiporter subunit D [Actinomyces sp.]